MRNLFSGSRHTVGTGQRVTSCATIGEAVRDFYRQHPELHVQYPFALLPADNERFAQFLLLPETMRRRLFNTAQIRCFLQETATRAEKGIVETYLLNPEWQRRFPRALMRGRDQQALLSWLKAKFSICVSKLPNTLSFNERRALRHLLRGAGTHSRLGVNILAHFCYPSGLQRAALTAEAALERAGVKVSARDVPAGVETELESRRPWLGLEVYPITLIMVAPIPHFHNVYERAGLARREGVYRIGSWYWELDKMPAEWGTLAQNVNEMWAPSEFIAQTMRAHLPVPVHRMEPGVVLGRVERVRRQQLGIRAEDFIFLFMFDMCSQIERKNPFALISAFRRAFSRSDPATLVIKVARGEADPPAFAALEQASQEAGVMLLHELSSRSRALGYVRMCDCFVSMHRSEGFGLPMAEAMMLGKPVIATNYSGNLTFMSSQNSYLIDYKLVDIAKSGPIYREGRWAEPSEEHAAVLMRCVFEQREEARSKGKIAQAEMRRRFSVAAAGKRMRARLEEIAARRRN